MKYWIGAAATDELPPFNPFFDFYYLSRLKMKIGLNHPSENHGC